MTDPKKEPENSGLLSVDVTPLLFLPSDELRSLFADLVPGSGEAISVARVFHAIAAVLTGERGGITGNLRQRLSDEGSSERNYQRAVVFMELAESLDGLGHASDGRNG